MARKRDDSYARALGPRIRRARDDAELRLEDIASACGVSTTAVHHWERGTSAAPALSLITIARITNCDLEWLLTGRPGVGFGGVRAGSEGVAVPRVGWKELDNLDYARKMASRFAMAKATVGPKAFSLVVNDGANAPQLMVGDECIFDPDITPDPEQFVLAVVGRDRSPVIRQYNERTDHVLLTPYNKAHKDYLIRTAKDGEIIATLVEFTRPMASRIP